MRCHICDRGFSTPGRFLHHAVSVHHANRKSVERAIAEAQGGALALVPTRSGRVMLLMQAPML